MSSDTLTNLISLISEYSVVPEGTIGLTDSLADIGLDSIDLDDLIADIEDHFDIQVEPSAAKTWVSVAHIHDYIVTATPA